METRATSPFDVPATRNTSESRAPWHSSPFGRRTGSIRRTSSSRAPEESIAFHVYVLQLQDDRFFVGSSSNVRERFAEHLSGKGGRVTTRWPPVGYGPIALSPPLTQPDTSDKDAFQTDVLTLERLITAQLILLLGVNRVRGGSVKDVLTDDGSIVTDYDLVHPRDYDRESAADLDLVSSKLSTSLCLDFIATRKHVDAMLRDNAGLPYFGTPKVLIDRGWNVIVNGQSLKHKSFEMVLYDPNETSMHPRIENNDWNVLFGDVATSTSPFDDMELGYSNNDYPDADPGHDPGDVFFIAFGVLLVSIITLSFTTFKPDVNRFLDKADATFAFVCLGVLLPTGIVLQMRQEKGPFNLFFVIVFVISTSLLASYAAIKASRVTALRYMDFALFMWTMGVFASAGVMAVCSFLWSKITGGRHGLVLSSIVGVIANISVLVAMFMLWSGQLPGGVRAGAGIKSGFGIGYLVITFGCLAVLLRDAWTVDVRERYWTKRAMLFVPSAVIPALFCYGVGYVLFACLSALKFV